MGLYLPLTPTCNDDSGDDDDVRSTWSGLLLGST